MNNLKEFKNDEIIKLIKDGKVTVADMVDSGICPTCFDRENNNILYGKNDDKIIYEEIQEKYKDYKINITLDVDISD